MRTKPWMLTRISKRMVLVSIMVILPLIASAADWSMRGRDNTRNAISVENNAPTDWDVDNLTNVKWIAKLGSTNSSEPVVSDGLIWIGTNNAHPRDPTVTEDTSVLMCFRERDGQFLYQYTVPRVLKHEQDWPSAGLASSPLIEGDRLWFCTNRCEVICLNIDPLKGSGGKPRTVWKVELRERFKVVPSGVQIGCHSIHCSIAGYKDLIYATTGDSASSNERANRHAPGLICLQKSDGKVQWQVESRANAIRGTQYGNPLVVEIDGRGQVISGHGDEYLRSFDAISGEELWQFRLDVRHPKRKYVRDLVAMPVFHEGRVYFATGKNLEFCEGPGALYCLDPTRRGDISATLIDASGSRSLNPNSGLIWRYDGEGNADAERMHATLASPVIHDQLVAIGDSEGIIHCVDALTGKRQWMHSQGAMVSSAALIADSKIYVGCESSMLIFKLSRQKELITERSCTVDMIEAAPIFANGTLLVTGRSSLLAISK